MSFTPCGSPLPVVACQCSSETCRCIFLREEAASRQSKRAFSSEGLSMVLVLVEEQQQLLVQLLLTEKEGRLPYKPVLQIIFMNNQLSY